MMFVPLLLGCTALDMTRYGIFMLRQLCVMLLQNARQLPSIEGLCQHMGSLREDCRGRSS